MVTKLEDHRKGTATLPNGIKVSGTARVKTKGKSAAILKIGSVADMEKYSKQIASGHNRARGLAQQVSIAAIAHMAEHGDYTIVYPLTDAIKSMGRNFYGPWLEWMQAHSWLRVKPGLVGRKRNEATPADLWTRDAALKPEANKDLLAKALEPRTEKRGRATAQVENVFWTYRKPASDDDTGRDVNVPDTLARFINRVQDAINNGKAVDANGKPMSYAAIKKLIAAEVDKLTARKVQAGREDKEQRDAA